MPTNIQALPLLTVEVQVAANEDWRDSFPFPGVGAITGFATGGNVGNGTIGSLAFTAGAPIGTVTAKILNVGTATQFGLIDGDGNVTGLGTVGQPYAAGGLAFLIAQGTTPFAVGDSFQVETLPGVIDISGIDVELMVRDSATDQIVALIGQVADGTLINGGASGILATAFDAAAIRSLAPGAYVLDAVAKADAVVKRVITGTLTVQPAVTY